MTISYVMPLITTEMGEIHFNSTISPWINETGMENTTDYPPSNEKHVTMEEQWLITFCYLFGIVGNVSALVILAKNETLRNKKQTLMMRCLAWNDLIALVGSFVLMYLKLYSTIDETHARLLCAIRVFWRTFGLGSGSVAVVMAVERFLALTKPFVYQKHITYTGIKWSIFGLWKIVAILVCLPFMGFGIYFRTSISDGQEKQECVRYRNATTPKDMAYAYVFLVFGLLVCICIVCCNLAVAIVLCRIRNTTSSVDMALVRRSTSRRIKGNRVIYDNHATQEEVAFAKLMAILCIFFVVCWFPQMCTVITALLSPIKEDKKWYVLGDICMALNFTLDPYVYVIFRRRHRKGVCRMLKPFFEKCWNGTASRKGSQRDFINNTFDESLKSSKDSQKSQALSNGSSLSSS